MKHPPVQYNDDLAKQMLEDFIAGNGAGSYAPADRAAAPRGMTAK